jgi:uncharacterized protein (TIGR03067 family)
MKTPILLSVLLVAAAVTTFAADKPTDAKDIQGTWVPEKAELGGKPLPTNFTLKLEADKYEVAAENLDKGTYKLDPAAKPRTFDITGVEGPNAGRKIPAIYELEGDTLRVCYGLGGSARPAEFKSPSGTKVFLVTYRRKKT